MSKDWESTFTHWSKGPASTESDRCENAIKAIKGAINKSDNLSALDIDVILQGSYRNRVNVRQDSDVDVGIICNDPFFYNLPDEVSLESANIVDAAYQFSDFKHDVRIALVEHFGYEAVTQGNKAFDIKANTYRVEADLAPFFEYRDYWNSSEYRQGVKLISDTGVSIENYPEQHYTNGVIKNNSTGRKYKRSVRILKNLRSEMQDKGFNSAVKIPGFLIECLVFNVPDDTFNFDNYLSIIREVLVNIFNNTIVSADCSKWLEVNNIKYLFHISQPWTKEQVHKFILDAWDYVGYE
ncbi:MAG: nucleotidyltransferase [Gammaproteobacteria bacterium]|jgi:hypothetical protein|nr:MAG: nucleotidyltransferase [Gammaproteobacteria bacterium]PHR83565.1 MAG: nucleotidyltransferase [Colwellia sp.]